MPSNPSSSPSVTGSAAAVGDACWNRIGVAGDRSCAKLAEHVHCRNCGIYSSAAARLLDRPLTPGYTEETTAHFAQPKVSEGTKTESLMLFRVGGEWLGLPTGLVAEVAAARPIHSLPHRRGGALLGLANVRGEVVVCLSLAQLLGISSVASAETPNAARRLLVVAHRDGRVAFPVDEVHGVERHSPDELKDAPLSVSQVTAHTRAVLPWRERAVGCLDAERLMQAVARNIA
jgi:chemotaxis-related protein WspD